MVRQFLRITDWHPTMNPNGRNSNRGAHWAVARKRHQVDRDMAWASARQANWEFVPGRIKLTITLVYPRTVRVDADNLVARCKGLIDGLKRHSRALGFKTKAGVDAELIMPGFFTDDSTQYLTLEVTARTEKGVKATEITLESLDDMALAAGRSDAAEDSRGTK